MSEKIVDIAKDLIEFKTIAENKDEIEACLDYCIDYFGGKDVVIQKFENEAISPVLVIANCEGLEFDAMTLGHIDVVPPSEEGQFEPRVEDGKLYGRGALDMKTWIAVAMNTMDHILENNLDVKFAIIITTDEETAATGAEYLAANTDITAKMILDVDVAGDITHMVTKCKNIKEVELVAKGKSCHGSLPWKGKDAIEKLMNTVQNLRKYFPYYEEGGNQPEQVWVDTMHVGVISGGTAFNVVPEEARALLNFRLTEPSFGEAFDKKMQECLVEGVTYSVKKEGNPVVVDEDNEYFKKYKACVEKYIGGDVVIEHIGGGTDSRHFAAKGITAAMHSGSGDGMHGKGEYCTLESIQQLSDIQIGFIESL